MPITFRNIDQSQNTNAVRDLGIVGNNITGAFDSLVDTLNKHGAKRDDNNVQNYLETLNKARTPEEVVQLRESGQLTSLLGQINDPAKRTQLNGAIDARIAGLQQQTTANQAYGDSQNNFNNRALRDQLSIDLVSADPTKRAAAQAQLSGSNILDKSSLNDRRIAGDAARLAATNALTKQTQDTTTFNQNSQKFADDRVSKFTEQKSELLKKRQALQGTLIGAPGQSEALLGTISKITDPSLTGKVASMVSDAMLSNPDFKTLPAETVKQIVIKRAQRVGSFLDFTRWGSTSDFVKDLDQALKEKGSTVSTNDAEISDINARIAKLDLQESAAFDKANPELAAQFQKQIDARNAQQPVIDNRTPQQLIDAGVINAPTTIPKQANAPQASTTTESKPTSTLEELANAERVALRLGIIKTLSPEVKVYDAKRSAIGSGIKDSIIKEIKNFGSQRKPNPQDVKDVTKLLDNLKKRLKEETPSSTSVSLRPNEVSGQIKR